MTLRKSRNKRLNVVLKGVGRLRITTGTSDRREHERRKALIMELYRDGRLDVLKALKDGAVSLIEVIAANRETGARSMTAITLVRPLWDAITDTLPDMGKGTETRNRYTLSLDTLKACKVLPPDARVRDLDQVEWMKVRPHFKGAADWNHLRRALSAFLSVYLGDMTHPYRRAVITRIETEKEISRTPDVSVESFWKAVALLPLWARDPVVCLALTGMRIGEYIHAGAHSLRPAAREIVVIGKTGERVIAVAEQAWPLIVAAIPARYADAPKPGTRNSGTWRYQRLEKAWRNATATAGISCSLHGLRHLAAQLASDAGFSDGAIADQHGHADAGTTRRYTQRRTRRDVADATASAVLRKIG